jgi:hypothetical protein
MLQWSMGSDGLFDTDHTKVTDNNLFSYETFTSSCHSLVILENLDNGDKQDVSITWMKQSGTNKDTHWRKTVYLNFS